MAIFIDWANEDRTIISYTFMGSTSWDEVYHALDVGEQRIQDRANPVDVLVDIRQAETLHAGVLLNQSTRLHAQNLVTRVQSMSGQIVVVGAEPILRSIYAMLRVLFAEKAAAVLFAPDLDAARTLLDGPEVLHRA